jgi:hypothetical protein
VTLLRGYIVRRCFGSRRVTVIVAIYGSIDLVSQLHDPAPAATVPQLLSYGAPAAAQDLRHAARGGADRLVAEPRQPRGAPRARS